MSMPSVAGGSDARELTSYELTVAEFVRGGHGAFVAVTDDLAFLATFRSILTKDMGLPEEALVSVDESTQTLKPIKEVVDAGKVPFVIMEHRLKGQDMGFMVKLFKTAYPDILLLVLSSDISKDRVVYLHEIGADNFIAKPVSSQTIVEKIAFTLNPVGGLGQRIDAAKALLRKGKSGDAKKLAEEILEMKPGSPAGLMVLGDAEMALGDFAAAKKAYLAASDNAHLFLEPVKKLVKLTERTGDLKECLYYLEQLDHLSPLNTERKLSMGKLNLHLGNEGKAKELFDAAMDHVMKEALDTIGALAEKVAAIYATKHPQMAEQFLRKALDIKHRFLSRDDLRIFNQLGISLRRQGKWKEAVDEYTSALRIAPDDATLHYNIAMAWAEGDRYDEALESLDRALGFERKLSSTAAGVAYNMGHVYAKCGLFDRARECFTAALKQNPGMKTAKIALEKLMAERAK